MKPSQYMDIINDIEERFPVDQWVADGIHVWPLIRIPLADEMQIANHANGTDHGVNAFHKLKSGLGLLNSLLGYCYSSILDFRNSEVGVQANDAVFLTITIDRVRLNGCFYNRLVDPLVECFDDFGARSLVLEMASAGQYCIPRHRPSKYIQPFLDYRFLRNKIHPKKTRNLNFQLDSYDDFVKYLEKLDLRINLPHIEHVKEKFFLVHDIAAYFERIMEQTNTSMGLSTQYYDVIGMAFNLACRRRNIVPVDIQHGMQGELHRAYGRWLKVPEKGYELLPEVFWCWSEYEAKAIRDWSAGVEDYHKPLLGGNPWLTKWLNQEDPIVIAYDEKISVLKDASKHVIHILYTLQIEPIPEWVLQSIAQSSDKCFWWIRAHPTQRQQRVQIKKLVEDHGLTNTEIQNAFEWPVYSLLRNIDVHVTAWSTTVLEAAEFGVPSIIIHRLGAEIFSEQINSGIVTVAHNAEELLRDVEYHCEKKLKQKLLGRNTDLKLRNGVKMLLDRSRDEEARRDQAKQEMGSSV